MAGQSVGINLPSYLLSAAAVTARNAEYTGTPFSDDDGTGDYNTYLGMNRGGSNAPGIGIGTGFVLGVDAAAVNDRPEAWTLLDQAGDARDPQLSGHIGFINDATDPDIAPTFTPAAIPVNSVIDPNGTPDFADEMEMAAAISQAAPGVGIGTANADPINRTNRTVEIGEVIWGTSTAP